MGFGDVAYTGLSIYGRIRAVIGLVVAVIIAVILFIFGRLGWTGKRRTTAWGRPVGKPRDCGDSQTTVMNKTTSTHYVCSDVQFEFKGVLYTAKDVKMTQAQYDVASARVAKGNVVAGAAGARAGAVRVFFDPANPAAADTSGSMSRLVAGSMMGGAVLFAAGAAFLTRLTFRSKEFAATTGALSATSGILSAM